MLYIYLPALYYHGNLYVTEGAYAGGRGFPLSQRSFLFVIVSNRPRESVPTPYPLVFCICTVLSCGVCFALCMSTLRYCSEFCQNV